MASIDPDPFTQEYNRVLEALETHAPLVALIKEANRIAVTRDRKIPAKQSITFADTPEFQLIPVGGNIEVFKTSTSASAIQLLELRLKTGDMRAQKVYFPLKWEVVRALSIAKRQGRLVTGFTRNLRVSELVDNLEDFDLDRGIQGWSGRIQIEQTLYFNEADLIGG